MSLLWDFLSWVSHCMLLGTSANILGFFWLIALVSFCFFRLKQHFEHGFYPKPVDFRRKIWFLVPLLISLIWVIYMQMVIDDGITTPINLTFGSWVEMNRGAFTLAKLFWFKWDIYFDVAFFTILFAIFGLWRFFHFTWKSLFWLSLTIIFNVIVGSQHLWNYVAITGDAHVWVFWLTYPEFRTLTGLFCASLLKKWEPPK